jgi:hypothetical protein
MDMWSWGYYGVAAVLFVALFLRFAQTQGRQAAKTGKSPDGFETAIGLLVLAIVSLAWPVTVPLGLVASLYRLVSKRASTNYKRRALAAEARKKELNRQADTWDSLAKESDDPMVASAWRDSARQFREQALCVEVPVVHKAKK